MSESSNASTVAPSEGLEALLMLSHSFSNEMAASTEFAGRSLSLDGFAVLVMLGSPAGSSAAKIGKRAASGDALRRGRRELLTAGLIAKSEASAGGRTGFSLTPKGEAELAAMRSAFADLATDVDPKSWKAIARLSRMTRMISSKLVKAEAPPVVEKPRSRGAKAA